MPFLCKRGSWDIANEGQLAAITTAAHFLTCLVFKLPVKDDEVEDVREVTSDVPLGMKSTALVGAVVITKDTSSSSSFRGPFCRRLRSAVGGTHTPTKCTPTRAANQAVPHPVGGLH